MCREENFIMLTAKQFKKNVGVHITTDHTAKMDGVASLSTSPLCNNLCKTRAASGGSGCICSHCYSMQMQRRYKNLNNALIKNAEILTSRILDAEELPILYSATNCFRFEAFGDLINTTQVVNYFNMALANPCVNCALWTKNPWIIENAIREYELEKPANLTIIASSIMLNTPMESYKGWDFIDNIFTVYTKEHIQANNVDVTCGGRSCVECGCKCYKGGHDSYYINEMLK